jgi:hypothetical protein
MRPIAALLASVLLISAVPPGAASAHHSFAMYDQSKRLVLKGEVRKFMWTNPHVIIWLNAAPITGGPTAVWSIEITSPGNLSRMGWTRNSLKPGDAVEMEVLPLIDGGNGGAFENATLLATGQKLTANWVQSSSVGPKP